MVMAKESKTGLFTSLFALFCTMIFLHTSLVSTVVVDSIVSSNLVRSPTYGKTFPALHSLEDYDGKKVVAIGSSIMQYSIDGNCIGESMESDDVSVFNLAVSGANPYTEILQIPALIKADPELVIIDLGPNGLWEFYESESLDEYIQFRFTINSIAMENDDIGGWTELIRERDKQWIAMTDLERFELTQQYSHRAFENVLLDYFDEYYDYIDHKKYAPKPNEDGWYDYLRTPSFLAPKYELLNDSQAKQLIDENMTKKKNAGVYNPNFNGTLNHLSYEYMLSELTNANIEVLLVAAPHHPYVYPHLDEGQMDGFNHTIDHYVDYYGVSELNMYWETWDNSMFRDRNHLGHNGREYYCERIAPVIDEIIQVE